MCDWAALLRRLGVVPFVHVCPTPPHTSPETKALLASLFDWDVPRMQQVARCFAALWQSDYSRYMGSDSEFGKLMRTARWLPGRDAALHAPCDLWVSGRDAPLLGEDMVCVSDSVCDSFARALGVRVDVTVGEVVGALKRWGHTGAVLSIAHMRRCHRVPCVTTCVASCTCVYVCICVCMWVLRVSMNSDARMRLCMYI